MPIEIIGCICAAVDTREAFKAWRATCKTFWQIAAEWPGHTARFANSFYELYKRFPDANWHWSEIAKHNYVPPSILIEWLAAGRFDAEESDFIRYSNIPWQFVEASWPSSLGTCLSGNPGYAEFFDLVIEREGEEEAYNALSWNRYLTVQFVTDHPSDHWQIQGISNAIGPDDIDFVLKHSVLHGTATERLAMEHIIAHPEYPWDQETLQIRSVDYVHTAEFDPWMYSGELPIEYAMRPDADMERASECVHIDNVLRHWDKLEWVTMCLHFNPSVTWQTVLQHSEVPWDFWLLSARDWGIVFEPINTRRDLFDW